MKYKATTEHLKSVIDAYGHTMKNQFVVITGTTSGTGFVCARELGLLGATVLLLNRKSARLDDSLQQLQQAVPKGQFDSIICDLQDFEYRQTGLRTRSETWSLYLSPVPQLQRFPLQ